MCRLTFFFPFIYIDFVVGNTNVIVSSTNNSVQTSEDWNCTNNSVQASEEWNCDNGTLLTSSVCVPYGYLKGEVPEKPTVVKTRIEINNILEVSDKKMRMTLDFYQELLWIDNRIKINLPDHQVSVLNNNLIDFIWKPDLWIKNLFDFKLHGILEPTGGLFIVGKDPSTCESFSCPKKVNTLVTYNMEAQATIHCNFHFVNYPMDTQTCEFEMDGSYPYPDIINLSFEFGYFGVTTQSPNIDDFLIDIKFENKANQTGIHAVINLQRCILPFVIKCYLPCIAIITVSLISFLISVDSVPARVGLLVTQFLTVTNILIAQQAESPSSGKFTALGVYLLASLFFVVAGFIEFAFVLQLGRYNESYPVSTPKKVVKNGKINSVDIPLTDANTENNSMCLQNKTVLCNHHGKQRFNLRKIDQYAFLVGGASFLLFNAVYWPTFLFFNFD